MIKLKPANIFDFYAPTGGGSKIADFKASKCPPTAPETAPTFSGTIQIEFSPKVVGEALAPAKKINLGYWIIGGMLVIGTAGYLFWYYSDEQKKKRRDEARNR
jgi:hypothetical protein